MLTQLYSALLALGIELVPFGTSTPAVSSVHPAGQVSQSPPKEVRADPGFSVINRCTVPGTVALTFDDGPFIYTNDIVSMLKTSNATGTFFYNGKNFGCVYDPDSVDRVKLAFNNGHQIASHTWSHADLPTLSWDQINDELWKIDDALNKIIGVTPAFIRPPYGNSNDLVLRAAAARGQTVVTWDFDSQDSAGLSADASKNTYSQFIQRRPDAILTLNHETSESAVHQVIPFAIQQLQAAGYRLVSVADCLGMPAYVNVGAPKERDPSWAC